MAGTRVEMPTGLTAGLDEAAQNGTEPPSFEDFLWRCARQFGPLVSMREAASDAEIPERIEPSTYHRDGLAEAEQELTRLEAMNDETAAALEDQAIADQADRLQRVEASSARLVEICRERLAEAEAWEPPTPDHQGLKDLMVQQLTDEITREIDMGNYRSRCPERLGGAGYRRQLIAAARNDVDYHSGHWWADQERAHAATEWIAALRESLAND